jgi:hypothetical protein
MRILFVVTLLLIIGCSVANNSTSRSYTRSADLAKESQQISDRERQCIRATVSRSDNQIAQIASSSDPPAGARIRIRMAANDRDSELAKCEATAQREKAELAARERAEYQRQATEQRERNSLMSILTTSLSR